MIEPMPMLRCGDHPENDDFLKLTQLRTHIDRKGNYPPGALGSTKQVVVVCSICDDLVWVGDVEYTTRRRGGFRR